MSTRHPTRPRRIDDALSQLVDSLTPPLPLSAIGDDYSGDAEEALGAAEVQRHQVLLERAWHTLGAQANSADNPASPSGSRGIDRRGSLAGGENINNASDLIKRKLLRENASPDKAVRFSNLYSRLLTQPVLSQKWGILYLLYRLSGTETAEGVLDEDERPRSPLMDQAKLQRMLAKDQRGGSGLAAGSDEDGPAVSSSASQMAARVERKTSLRRPDLERERDADRGSGSERPPRTSRHHDSGPKETRTEEHETENNQELARPIESSLLRDLPFNLQGLSSSDLQFMSASTLKLPPGLPLPMVSLLNTLAEPCLLYRGLSTFVDGSGGGLISQSLRAALANELRSYLGLVATLEGEIRRALAAPVGPNGPKSAVTLKRCVVWTRDATMALRLMSLIVEEAHSTSKHPSWRFN
ncbi:Putative Gamma-tubulin complex protein 3 (Eurofung) [Aspergillus calidoustus]|uniref:Putative Gamma-tubulin complex protein 3 (Eurofung) n=1 Tax=Aspergillus calidoustus TaxID=454130 RepID=A0A0U5GC44_ASPCI|nr:Putative Gamma-tubulin complex protein 3 (Eurofung) [Aspergillus calidoustus]